jgi:hypothetical protein
MRALEKGGYTGEYIAELIYMLSRTVMTRFINHSTIPNWEEGMFFSEGDYCSRIFATQRIEVQAKLFLDD